MAEISIEHLMMYGLHGDHLMDKLMDFYLDNPSSCLANIIREYAQHISLQYDSKPLRQYEEKHLLPE